MGILSRIFSRSAPETRDLAFSALSPALGDMYIHGGIQSADKLAAVAACVRLISASISSLPASLTVDSGTAGREPAPLSASAWRLINRPGPRRSWPSLMSSVVKALLLDGNCLCRLDMDGRGAVIGLTVIPWAWVSPVIIGDRLAYDIWVDHPEAKLMGLPKRLLEGDVIHFRGQSDAGFVGQSVLTRARGPVSEGLAIETLAAANWRNGARPSAALSLPTFLDDTRRKRFREETLPELSGAINAGKLALLEGGLTFQPLSLNSIDTEFLETRKLNTSQVAMLFGVPEILLQLGQRLPNDMAPFVTQFAQLALAPIVTAIEAEFDHVILPPGQHLSIDLDGLMRGSFSSTVAALAALKQSGIVTANDARAELDWPPVNGGDDLQVGSPPSWPADGPGSKHLGPSPGKTGDGVANVDTNQNEGG